MNKQLIKHCAPTLAGIKPANIFSYTFSSNNMLLEEIAESNTVLNPKGIFVRALRLQANRALILVYRKSMLLQCLAKEDIRAFLTLYGYCTCDIEGFMRRLKSRLQEEGGGFPHEIGILLGYPLEDVIGFIENAGRESKCSGCWKVYCDECAARKLFAKYNKCKAVYMRLFAQGETIERLTVAA